MDNPTTLQFAWLHVANVLLGMATLAAVVAMLWAMAVDVGRFVRTHRH